MMKIEITQISVSKKGTVWIQAKELEVGPDDYKVGDVLECEVKPKEEKKDEPATT